MGMSLARRLSLLSESEAQEWVTSLPDAMVEEMAKGEWWYVSRPEQIPPEGNWFIHMVLSGRGWGKSRSGSEWIVEQCTKHPVDRHGFPTEWLVIAETTSDCRNICLEGPSGILRVLERRQIPHRAVRSPKPKITLTETGTKIHFEGADSPDVGRGYNAAGGWLDEVAKWKTPRQAWIEGIAPSMRADLMGDHPRVFVTTTPKPIDLIREWVERDDGTISIVRGSTFDNSDNLSPVMLEEMRKRYEGTQIGRQELYGELIDLFAGTLFRWSDIQANRVTIGPSKVMFRVLGCDPSLVSEGDQVDSGETGLPDEMGIVICSRDHNNHIYVVGDESRRISGREAALHIWDTFGRYECDLLVYENNLGKKWMADVLTDAYVEMRNRGVFPAHTSPPMQGIDSKHGKVLRAEPVAMRYEQGSIHHIGKLEELEYQMTTWDPTDGSKRSSPDRVDALVHACRWLMGSEKNQARIHAPQGRRVTDRWGTVTTNGQQRGLYTFSNQAGRAL